ncbi:MAG: GntR family transcriptional regulator [Tepidisphaeraceae bacterium]
MRLAIDHNDPTPLHVKVERLLRRVAARADHARHGKPLPGEVELANRLGVSRSTVRHAMGRLVHEGLLERKRNAGTRVSRRPLITSLTDWFSFSAEMARQGVKLRSLHVDAALRPLPADVAEFFRLPARSRCLCVTRLRGDDDGPIVEFQSWLHPRIGLAGTDDFSQPLYELIERRSGVTPRHSSEQIEACRAGNELAKVLACDASDPVLRRERRVTDVGRKPIEWCVCSYRGDRFTYAIDIRRSDA